MTDACETLNNAPHPIFTAFPPSPKAPSLRNRSSAFQRFESANSAPFYQGRLFGGKRRRASFSRSSCQILIHAHHFPMASHHPPISGCRAQADGINWPQMQLREAADFISEGLRPGERVEMGALSCARDGRKKGRL
ncbi:hypothetical protein CEXT_204921 [Caerostris extrusa]|uniref:Uncharacterized protein n=1 Tax=Caerostris extrusa TaxID=172846 RepID=A0AAV4XKN7_CAEEX|nr:hypothetical protein CEXT_204921 [Caerostris extrusa]